MKHVLDTSCELVGDLDLWHECSGEKVKGRTFGTSSLLDPYFLVTGMPSTPSICISDTNSSKSTIEVLWLEEKLDQQEEEHVRRETALKKEFEGQQKEDRLNGKRSLRNSKILCLEDHHIPLLINDDLRIKEFLECIMIFLECIMIFSGMHYQQKCSVNDPSLIAFTDGSLTYLTVSVALFSSRECGKFVGKERQIVANARTRYSGADLSFLLLYILKELAHAKSGALS
ncbi:hypothetical protein Tco_1175410 [Tanacetum coccineum]